MNQFLENTLNVVCDNNDRVISAAIQSIQKDTKASEIVQLLKLMNNQHTKCLHIIADSFKANIVDNELFESLYDICSNNSYIFQYSENKDKLKETITYMLLNKSNFSDYQLTLFIDTLECLIAKGVDIKKETVKLLRSLESDMPNIAYSENMLHIKMAIATYGYCDINKKDMFKKLDDIVYYIRSNKLHHIKGMMHYYLWRFKSMNNHYVFSHYSTWNAQEHLDKSYEKGFHLAKLI